MVNNKGRPINLSPTIPTLMENVNTLMKAATRNDDYHEYNACLQNWYTPEDTMGLYSDDEPYNYVNYPIFSISWGGRRRFLLRPKEGGGEIVEIWLEDGDLLIMGGTCQKTHKHEVPKQRKEALSTSNRIN
jgi:alkylated DNA repair dioxygenase AlkB